VADDAGEAVLTIGDKQWPVSAEGVVELDPLPSPARRARLLVRGGGGDVLIGPVTYRFEEGILANGSWFEQGLQSYIGAVRMRQTFRYNTEPTSRAVLDLGRVLAVSVEATLNETPLGRRVAPPPPPSFQFDLATRLRRGDNELELLVRNSPDQDCGVFGPVRVFSLPGLP
jgi:hypothetical protein